jgi:HEPN domain-containing protein
MNSELRQIVHQWMGKARDDWATVTILIQSEYCPNDIVCFHCQQYVEKLLKGFLTACEVEFPKTHDLRRLIQLCVNLPALSSLSEKADELTNYGVQSRYPDAFSSTTKKQVKVTVAAARSFADLLEPVILGMIHDEL